MSDGQLNRYTCEVCNASVITVDAGEGVTPFMIGCKTTAGCSGRMVSSFYRGVSGVPTFVWRKPTAAEYKASSSPMRHHYDQGGLDIHPIKGTEPTNPNREA